MTAPIVDGWKVLPNYAEPTAPGGGYVELVGADLLVAYESDSSAREMGVDAFLVTAVPVEVIRALLAQYDAARLNKCALCSGPATGDDYCYGCDSRVCAKCDHPDADKRPQGDKHEPAAHRVQS